MPFVSNEANTDPYTGNDIIDEVLRLMLSGQREDLNQLSSDIDATTTTITVKHDLNGIRSNALIDIGLETMRVWSVDVGSKTATVLRGANGTAPAVHSADDLVSVNPRLPRSSIFKALNDELRTLSSGVTGLYRMQTYEFTAAGVVTDYALPEDVLDVYAVRVQYPGPDLAWTAVNYWEWKPSSDLDSYPGGNALHIPLTLPSIGIQVLYKTGFGTLTTPEDLIYTTTGMPPEMQDLLALGCLMRLGPVREIKRSFTEPQGDARRAEEVASGNVQQSFSYVRQLRQDRINQEAARLAAKYPMRHPY